MAIARNPTKKLDRSVRGLACAFSCFMLIILVPLSIDSQTASSALDQENRAKEMALGWTDLEISSAAETFLGAGEAWRQSGRMKESARCLIEAATLLRIKGEGGVALVTLEEAIRRANIDGSLEEKAQAAASIASLDLVDGGSDNSRQTANRALNDAERSADARTLSIVLRVWGEIYYAANDSEGSVRVLEKSLAIADSLDDPQLQVQTAVELSYAKLKVADFRSALALASKASAIAAAKGDKRAEAMSLKALGKIYIALTENGRAFEELKRAERLFPKNADRVEKATLLNALAQLYERYGDQYLALEYRREAYDLFAKENHQFGLVGSTADLALSYCKNGDVVAAREFLQKGLRIEQGLNNKFMRARLLEHLGATYLLEKNPRPAIRYFENALQLFRETNAVSQLYRVKAQYGIAFKMIGDLASAENELNSVFEFAKSTHNLEMQANVLTIQGQLARDAGDVSTSLSFFSEAVRLTENQYNDVSNSRLQQTFLASAYDRYEMFSDALIAGSSSNEENLVKALMVKEQSRSRRLVQNLTLFGPTDKGKIGEDELMFRSGEIRARLNSLADKLDKTIGLQLEREEEGRLRLEMALLENDLALVEVERSQGLEKNAASRQINAIDILEFQKDDIDGDTVLLEFHFGANNSYLWLVEKNEISGYQLPQASEIDSYIDGIRNNLALRYLHTDAPAFDTAERFKDLDREYYRLAREFSSKLLGSAALRLRGKRLVIVLDGKLQYFPIGALPWPGSDENEPIIVTNEVAYVPSASVLGAIRSGYRSRAEATRDVLVFADPVFSKDDDRLSGSVKDESSFGSVLGTFRSVESLDTLARLPASSEEAASIKDIVGTAGTDIRLGFDANRANALAADVADHKILHFATHGLVEENRPELSGIVLSLFDENGKINDGGFIRLQDVYGMNLKSDLVVLSACDTGLGKIIKGEGVMSLNNAFLQAGASTVVSSLWKVDDQATKELMTEFYRGMAQDGLTVSAALRQAQIKLYNDPRYKSPFYWAAFTMHGDYDRVPQISSRYSRYAWVAGCILFLAMLWYLYQVRRELARY